jgi:hypothetical protein
MQIKIPGTQSRVRIELFSLEQCTANNESKRVEEEQNQTTEGMKVKQ